MLLVADMLLGPLREIVILGRQDDPDTATVLKVFRKRYLPICVVACRPDAQTSNGSSPLARIFAGKQPQNAATTVFVCENFACQAPISGKDNILATWDRIAQQS